MKRYWLKEEALIDIKEENSISGRDICRLTIRENVLTKRGKDVIIYI